MDARRTTDKTMSNPFTSSWLARLQVEQRNKFAGRDVVDKPPCNVSERDIHDEIESYCRARGWLIVHSRMDMRTTCAVGTPDFIIFADRGRKFNVEVKRPGQKLRPEQAAWGAHAHRLGHHYAVVHSMKEFEEEVLKP